MSTFFGLIFEQNQDKEQTLIDIEPDENNSSLRQRNARDEDFNSHRHHTFLTEIRDLLLYLFDVVLN